MTQETIETLERLKVTYKVNRLKQIDSLLEQISKARDEMMEIYKVIYGREIRIGQMPAIRELRDIETRLVQEQTSLRKGL